ncbi:Fic family protein [Kribbella sp. HUAS MG21]|uniref:protein adenylyltransferase n=1 Tax=Kribbella sp. HUAS MG21 TaxID=3160966 RepID=A0AAU7TD79_9ACTN
MPTFENWGDYFWPGQIDDCKINKLGIHDAAELERAERSRTAERAVELIAGDVEIPRTFDLDHLRAIHRHLFQDVYDWAGDLRVTELVRPSQDPDAPGNEFVKPEDIERLAPVIFSQLGDPADLRNRPTHEVVDVLARTYAGVNVLHPFVEGNGRTQRIFLDHVAEAAGYRIDWTRIADRQNEVMAEAFGIGAEPVREALAECIEPLTDPRARQDTEQSLRLTTEGITGAATIPTHGTKTTPSSAAHRISSTRERGPDERH